MADLQSCYFCGAPDDIGEYAVVPPRLGGGDRSVVLCSDCKTKLLRVMEPLIERAEAGDGGSAETDGSTAAQSSTDAHGDPGPATDGITMSAGGSSEPSGGSSGEVGGGAEGDGTGGSGAGGDSTGGAGSGSRPGDGAETPPSYRRAMRMLSNRPFPIDRSEAESMLANAYDLEREEIDGVLSHAALEGRLVVEDGEIREA
ncbi:hypothetical protein [Halolamina sediminis]|uniref:hypothetical protein n=1 Tax=Halolamina sediminis TaxID=1480675 RepID=UPI0006B696E6|nr:hypothetical protein [Halolamina sediminis]